MYLCLMNKLPYQAPGMRTLDLDLQASTLLAVSPTGESYDPPAPYDDGFDD